MVSGSLRATDTIYSTTNQFKILQIPTTSGGTTYSTGTNGQILKSNGTSVYWASDNNSDINVTQAAVITTEGAYPLILANSTATTAVTGTVNKTSTLTYNPNTKALITGGTIDGYALAAASAKAVDTSISNSSASTNLPTSAAVANFVEGKGYKIKQEAIDSPSAEGSAAAFISTISQNTNGEITATKANLPVASTATAGMVQLSDAINSTSTFTAATSNAVKTAYDLAASKTANTGTVTSITLLAGDGISLSSTSAITTSGTRTITNTGVRSIATGSSNGTISVNTNGTTANIAIKGLGSAAYTNSTAYATAAQGTLATNAMPKSGGTFTGAITLAENPTTSLQAATKQYVDENVSISNTLNSGIELGTITINGISTTIYTPAAAPQTISVTQSASTPTLEFIVGTHTSSTATMTGVLSTTTTIADGKIIYYLNPYAWPQSQTTLTLAYADSGNSTSAIPIYKYGSTRSKIPFPAGSIVTLIYYNSKFYIANNLPAVI